MHRPSFAIPSGMTLAPEPAGDAGPRWVMARAEEELVARYDGLDDSELGLTPVMFDPPTGAFLVARDDARPDPVGGVGLRTIGGDAGARAGEVKRLWVDPSSRGRGVGRALMAALEEAAHDLGLVELELATGDRQPEAVALYAASGWERRFEDAEGNAPAPGYIRFTKRLM
jgi:GNAT superfamily N-acetyltransferase